MVNMYSTYMIHKTTDLYSVKKKSTSLFSTRTHTAEKTRTLNYKYFVTWIHKNVLLCQPFFKACVLTADCLQEMYEGE